MPRTFVWHPGKGPAKARTLPVTDGTRIRIKQVRSGIGHSERMRATLTSIGLRHHQAVIERELTPSLRGQLTQVRHLVEVTPLEGETKAGAKKAKGGTRGK